jgi:hypothetical protein
MTGSPGAAGAAPAARRPGSVGARDAVLDPADVEHSAGEVDLVPAEVADLGGPETMPVGQQDHGGVPVTVLVAPEVRTVFNPAG